MVNSCFSFGLDGQAVIRPLSLCCNIFLDSTLFPFPFQALSAFTYNNKNSSYFVNVSFSSKNSESQIVELEESLEVTCPTSSLFEMRKLKPKDNAMVCSILELSIHFRELSTSPSASASLSPNVLPNMAFFPIQLSCQSSSRWK